ncbi:Macrolide export ATP-binding/permease protein macB [Fibrella aestuarina BUZ 2]|uniref:Macrolide export ATP-binding/permease protein macB n=1 Tax=Fibrella aestuarina BUZ 2 TaxID=1166018 RepID=I0K1V0_9BACT|nr:ABC transporter permease [Fibrella aestuarina]CCG98103.1 Macrolide export ATP-binding/permease protein macB [Fibrella aestuarina BUZ 2]
MWSSYLKIAWRNLIRNKMFSAINIVGLALGLASSILILLWVQDERRIGTHYPNARHLYRVMEHEKADGRIVTDEDTPGILADELKRVLPEVRYAAGFSGPEEHVLQGGQKTARQQGRFAGADWFRMCSLPLLAGSPQSALTDPNSITISRKLAVLYFGSPQQAVGKTLRIDNWQSYQVTAVFENLSPHTAEPYEFLINWQAYLAREPWLTVWENAGPGTHLQLRADADPEKVGNKLRTFLKGRNKDFGPYFSIDLFLQPETEAYLYSHFTDGHRDGGRIEYVRLFVVVALFLLLIAGVNFMNLATARSVKRAREVGVRKAIGAERSSLIGQFLSEAILLTTLALLVAILLVNLLLPGFNQLTGKQLALPLGQPSTWATMVGILLAMGLLAGSYPAFFLSSLNPVQVLKSSFRVGGGAQSVRRALVIVQFALSMLLIVGTLVIYQQLQYIQRKNLGFNRAGLIQLPLEGALVPNYSAFREQLRQLPGIQSVTYGKSGPLGNNNTSDGVSWPGKDPTAAIQFTMTAVGYDFTKTMGVRVSQGRDYSPEFRADTANYLINQAAANRIGYKDPVGKPLTVWGKAGTIIGVLNDYHFNSLHKAIRPLVIRFQQKGDAGVVLVRAQPGQTQQAIASLEAVCRRLNPAFPFAYSFVDADFATQYRSETVVSRLATLFAGLAIFIACLGLFGLAAFTAEQRTKEIGVRKVLGASVSSIVALLSRDFLKPVLIAIGLASPLAWWATSNWLAKFAYRIELSWWLFALAGLLAVGIAFLTVSFQSIKAALMSPVKSLRSE